MTCKGMLPAFVIRRLVAFCLGLVDGSGVAGEIQISGVPVELAVRSVSPECLRLTLRPLDHPEPFPENPGLVDGGFGEPVFRLVDLDDPVSADVGELRVELRGDPLRMRVTGKDGGRIQNLEIDGKGAVRFVMDDGMPVLGLGEGGPRPTKGVDWRTAAVEFDRRGRLHRMEPRWQADAYGSRNPVPLLVGTGGWALHFATPWGRIDLREADHGRFLPVEAADPAAMRQNHANQSKQLGKGIPPMESFVPGFLDLFVFDAREPTDLMRDLSTIAGRAIMPPKWALGYMQSHRTLEDDDQMIEIVDTFRKKRIPVDAVIYLGTGFTDRGWNTHQPSFDFNPEVVRRTPKDLVRELHDRDVKVILHMVPWDRDRLPLFDEPAFEDYWNEHRKLADIGVDGWWPDEGDWFDLFERIRRHRFYHDGPLSTRPDLRPWSLHRNGYLGVGRWGGWVWSGDTDSTWKTLEAQIAVGINHSLSLSPHWGSDIGGFFPTPELDGELYARWFQFGAFCSSFRSHGRTWWTRLPWGWGLDSLGPVEHPHSPDASALGDPEIEKVAREYAELRYRLLSYNYTMARETMDTGMPMMRALWLHHPGDRAAAACGDQFLWGGDLLVAPVYEKGAVEREVYLPAGGWYDFWSGEKHDGPRRITRKVDLRTMPVLVREGAVLPLDPVRQHVGEQVSEPLTLLVHQGADGGGRIYSDDGTDNGYLEGESSMLLMEWNDSKRELILRSDPTPAHQRTYRGPLRIRLVPEGEEKSIEFDGVTKVVKF